MMRVQPVESWLSDTRLGDECTPPRRVRLPCRCVRAEQPRSPAHRASSPLVIADLTTPSSARRQWEGASWLVGRLIQQVISKLVQASLRTGLLPRQITILNGKLSWLRSSKALALPPGCERPRSPSCLRDGSSSGSCSACSSYHNALVAGGLDTSAPGRPFTMKH